MSNLVDKNKVVVRIFGEDYPITGVADPSYISRVADYVDSKMKEVAEASQVKVRDRVAILAAMSIASEFYEKAESLNSYEQEYDSRLDAVISQLDAALADHAPGPQ